MTLLKIQSEPSNPQPSKIAVGIDLGTTHSLIALHHNKKTEILLDEQKRELLPSVVHYRATGERETGFEALQHLISDPQNTITSIKRLMGRSYQEVCRLHCAKRYKLRKNQPEIAHIQTICHSVTPIEVSAEILRVLYDRAQAKAFGLGDKLIGAVITVPAYFD